MTALALAVVVVLLLLLLLPLPLLLLLTYSSSTNTAAFRVSPCSRSQRKHPGQKQRRCSLDGKNGSKIFLYPAELDPAKKTSHYTRRRTPNSALGVRQTNMW